MSQDMTNSANCSTQREKSAAALVSELDSTFFKTLSEPVRIELLKFLMLHGSSDIGTISENMPQDRSVISRHLNLMLSSGLVSSEKQGRHTFYDVDSQFFLTKFESIAEQIRVCMKEFGIPVSK